MAATKAKASHKSTLNDLPLRLFRPRLSEDLHKHSSDVDAQHRASPFPKAKASKTRLPVALAGSPYNHRILPRSLSVTKLQDKLSKPALSRIDTSALRPKETLNLTEHNISFGSTFDTSLQLKSPKGNNKRRSLLRTVKLIEINLNKELRDLAEVAGDKTEKELHAYSLAFSQLIDLNSALKPLLSRIKLKYEVLIQRFLSQDVFGLQRDLHTAQQALAQTVQDKAMYASQLDKAARDNKELSRVCLDYQRRADAYEEKWRAVAKGKDSFPPTKDTWKLMNVELEAYRVWKDEMTRQIAAAHSKEQEFLHILQRMRSHGIQVDDYLTDTPDDLNSAASQHGSSSETDLLLENIEVESTQIHQNSTIGVPKLSIPVAGKRPEFHEEFMSRYAEFSESWRKQIDAQMRKP